MAIFNVEMLPAEDGDSLWIEYGEEGDLHRVLIDGGRLSCLKFVEQKIAGVAEENAAKGKHKGKCVLELLVLSHVDGDHIEGLIKLLGDASVPVNYRDVWFNSLEDMPSKGEAEPLSFSAKQGEFLAALLRERFLPWNKAWDGGTIWVPSEGELPRKELPGGLVLTLLSPNWSALEKMHKRWVKELDEKEIGDYSHEQILEMLEDHRSLAPRGPLSFGEELLDIQAVLDEDEVNHDQSAANGSSIAFLAEYDGRACLLAGDAHPKVLDPALERLAKERGVERLKIGAFKLPHHASRNNVHESTLEHLECSTFMISTNGRAHGHPDDAALARVVGGQWREASIGGRPIKLLFNYRTEHNQGWDDEELRADFNYETVYPAQGEQGLAVEIPES